MPSAAAWARAVPAIAALRPGFVAPDAHVLPGASTNPDFDIYQWQATQNVSENAFSRRLDVEDQQQLVDVRPGLPRSGREPRSRRTSAAAFFKATLNPTNAIFNLQGILGNGMINEFKFGYNGAPSTEGADTQTGFENIAISLTGNVANAGIAGQGVGLGARRARRPGPRQQRRQRPRRAVQPVLADLRRHAQPHDRAITSSRWAATSA